MDTFEFAGFTFPRAIPRLVSLDYCGAPNNKVSQTIAKYKEARKLGGAALPGGVEEHKRRINAFRALPRFKVDTAYSSAPRPEDAGKGTGFYHGSDFAPGLRWQWCDEVEGTRIGHTGWYTDDDGTRETIRGTVHRLPHGRGFLIGHSMGEGMSSWLDCARIFDCERDAARAADSLAESVAEKEREYQSAWRAGQDAAEAQREAFDAASAAKVLRRELRAMIRAARRAGIQPGGSLCETMREKLATLAETVRENLEKVEELRRDYDTQRGASAGAFRDGFGEA